MQHAGVRIETLVKGTEPKEYCNIHGPKRRVRDNAGPSDNNASGAGDTTPQPQPSAPKAPDDKGNNLRMTPPPAIPIDH